MQIDKPYRVSHRLRGFDYSLPGAYYVTICTCQKRCLFGTVQAGKMQLSRLGEIVHEEWMKTPALRPRVRLGEFEVMPNHVHGIIIIVEGYAGDLPVGDAGDLPVGDAGDLPVGDAGDLLVGDAGDLPVAPTMAGPSGPWRGSLGAIIGNFKGAVTGRIRQRLDKPRFQVWQRNYYDHIIRDDNDWQRIRAYILDNAMTWSSDPLNPSPP